MGLFELVMVCGEMENTEIYVWDGEQVINVSQNPAHDAMPAWSSDGRLAWISERDGNAEIYVWDGEQVINVSQNPDGDDRNAIWSDDGRLAWHSERDLNYDFHSFGNYDIYIWDREQVINFGQSIALDAPMWNADGWLAWVADTGIGWDIYIWDGEQISNVTNEGSTEVDYSWAP